MRKCRIGTAKFFTLLLLLYRTSVKPQGIKQLMSPDQMKEKTFELLASGPEAPGSAGRSARPPISSEYTSIRTVRKPFRISFRGCSKTRQTTLIRWHKGRNPDNPSWGIKKSLTFCFRRSKEEHIHVGRRGLYHLR